MRHQVIYAQAGVFAGWPANNGAWSWDDGREILVGLTVGAFEEKPGHNIREPYHSLLARSTDGGQTWATVQPENFVGSGSPNRTLSEGLDFMSPGFAMRVEAVSYHGSTRQEGGFFASNDRGRTWHGPFAFNLANLPPVGGMMITSRTDYIVEGPRQCLVMMTLRGESFPLDRTFCIRTTDGGRTFGFVSWVAGPGDPYRAVMPSSVRMSTGRLVSVIRRSSDVCWADCYISDDEGGSWRHASKVGQTGVWNGNPPALVGLRDGRLCAAFGNRTSRQMVARISEDQGQTWGPELVLRADFQPDRYDDPDFGYPRLVQRADGQVMCFYYWSSPRISHQHIAATIWQP
jgi:hypothetical protein